MSRTMTTIDAHAGGEPLRIITAGAPPLPGATILARRRAMLTHHDDLRRMLMWEPRGHTDMYGCILTPPVTPDAAYGVLFMHNEGYSTMCGHGIIALTTALLETGQLPRTGPITTVGYDTPAGFILARAEIEGERVRRVTFRNVPSFVHTAGLQVVVEGKTIVVDVVFGGAFYALVAATALDTDLSVRPERVTELIARGMAVKRVVEATVEIAHPTEPELRGIYGTIITGPAEGEGARQRNVTVFAEGEVDRSPCGTGTAATTAAFVSCRTLALGEEWVNESIIGTRFTGRAIEATHVGDYPAIIPEIGGRGFITGYHTFVLDPDDEAGRGFLVR